MSFNSEERKNEILNKKFRKNLESGYDPEDVDSFFDKVILYIDEIEKNANEYVRDAKNIYSKIDYLKNQINEKDKKIEELNQTIAYYEKEGYSSVLEKQYKK